MKRRSVSKIELSGRDLDAAIAVALFGWKWWLPSSNNCYLMSPAECKKNRGKVFDERPPDAVWVNRNTVPCWSSSWGDMSLVLEEMERRGFDYTVANEKGRKSCGFDNVSTGGRQCGDSIGDHLPTAVCRAALRAIEPAKGVKAC